MNAQTTNYPKNLFYLVQTEIDLKDEYFKNLKHSFLEGCVSMYKATLCQSITRKSHSIFPFPDVIPQINLSMRKVIVMNKDDEKQKVSEIENSSYFYGWK